MDNQPNKFKLHPLTAAAAVAVILLCMTGIAAMTGILPSFNKTPTPDTSAPAPDVAAAATASQPADTAATASAPVAAPADAPTPVKKPAPKKPVVVANNQVPPAPAPQPDQTPPPPAPAPEMPPPPPPCPNCGVVESARLIQQQAPTSGVGAAAGALLGGVLGHQVGGGNGKTLATIAGAVGGGLAGNAVEKNSKTSTQYEVIVRMENGTRQRFVMSEQRWRAGDQVQVNNGYLAPRNQ